MANLIKLIEEHHKYSLETICIDVWLFLDFLVAQESSQIGPTEATNSKKIQFETSRSSVDWFKTIYLIKIIGRHHTLSSEVIYSDILSFWAIPLTPWNANYLILSF